MSTSQLSKAVKIYSKLPPSVQFLIVLVTVIFINMVLDNPGLSWYLSASVALPPPTPHCPSTVHIWPCSQ